MKIIKYHSEISRSDLNECLFNKTKRNQVVTKETIDDKKQLDSLIQLLANFYLENNSRLRLN